MMKKVSYLLILFASLFVFVNVKASISCKDTSGNTYIFNSDGTISTLRGKLTYYMSPGSTSQLVMTSHTEEVSITKKPYYDSSEEEKLKLGTDLVYDVCPKPEELHYEVNTKNVYTVSIDEAYYSRRNEIICSAVSSMKYNLVFDSNGYLKQVTDKSGNEYTVYGVTTTRWRLNSKENCPTSETDFTVKKHSSFDAYIVTPTESYETRINSNNNNTDPTSNSNSDINGCSDIEDMIGCTSNSDFSCVWVDKDTGNISKSQENGYCNVDTLQYVACGGAFDVPVYLPRIISFIINLLKIATPIVLIFTSAISLVKAITASKEDEMEKAKKTLIRRIAIAVLIFFTITITQFVVEKVADDDEVGEFKDCLSCFINNDCAATKYYKNNIGGEYKCFYVKTNRAKDNCH